MSDHSAIEKQKHEDRRLPRLVQVLAGIVLGLFTLLCLAGSLMMLFMPNEKAPVLAHVFGAAWTVVCGWMLSVCVRLIRGKEARGGLMSPPTLKAIAWLFVLLPVGGLFTGYFLTHTVVAVIQSAAYISIFFGLQRLAAYREENGA